MKMNKVLMALCEFAKRIIVDRFHRLQSKSFVSKQSKADISSFEVD